MGDTAMVSEYTVMGMVCQHCVTAITEEVGAIEGITDVRVDLDTGRVCITSNGPVDAAAVHAAIHEAGYEIPD
jgi:copper ion binding protein